MSDYVERQSGLVVPAAVGTGGWRRCALCGCSDERACIDGEEACTWDVDFPDFCTFCMAEVGEDELMALLGEAAR